MSVLKWENSNYTKSAVGTEFLLLNKIFRVNRIYLLCLVFAENIISLFNIHIVLNSNILEEYENIIYDHGNRVIKFP